MDQNGGTPSTFLDLLDTVTRDGVWKELKDREGEPFGTFTQFVTARRPEGLGLLDKGDLQKHLALQHKEEREPYRRQATVDRMAAMRQKVGELLGLDRLEGLDHGGNRRSLGFQLRDTQLKPPVPDTTDRVIARLKRDDPDLAQQVIRGEKTANAAALVKGWRKPRIILSSPERVAKSLRKHYPDP